MKYKELKSIFVGMIIIVTYFLCNLLLLTVFSLICHADDHKEPTYVKADSIEYDSQENFIYAKGNLQIKLDQYTVFADDLLYDIENDLLWAQGNIKVLDTANRKIFGETLFLKNKLKSGIISDFALRFSDNTILASKLARRISENKVVLHNARFTPCTASCNSKPIWQISAKHTYADFDEEKIVYRNLFFEVYGVPIFYLPYFSHPTPSAKAQSGVLVPEIKDSSLRIPLYMRVKPNMDFTFTPRVATKYTIYEFEARHRVENGSYLVEGSYGKTPYTIQNKGILVKDSNVNRYHLFTKGSFSKEGFNYGFDLKRTSDKAYLKNYYEILDPYLTSKIYFNKVQHYNYYLIEGLHFYGLRSEDAKNSDPIVFPRVKTKNIINFDEEERYALTMDNDALTYREQSGKELVRSSTKFTLTSNQISSKGILFNANASTRGDLYLINDAGKKQNIRRGATRNIPEFQSSLRYPLFNRINDSNAIIVEPIVSSTIGRSFRPSYNKKYAVIDSSMYEISENNLFLANHYSGIDYHEFGNRVSYGINSGIMSGENYFDFFLGQFLYNKNAKTNNNSNIVGKIGAAFPNNISLFYRFRKDKKFNPILDELGFDTKYRSVQFSIDFIRLENLRKYYSVQTVATQKNHIKQFHFNVGYWLTDNIMLGNEMRLDLSNKKPQLLYRSIRVTYFKDCVSITGKFYDDYTSDSSRGIKKVRSKTISIGLKILNM